MEKLLQTFILTSNSKLVQEAIGKKARSALADSLMLRNLFLHQAPNLKCHVK